MSVLCSTQISALCAEMYYVFTSTWWFNGTLFILRICPRLLHDDKHVDHFIVIFLILLHNVYYVVPKLVQIAMHKVVQLISNEYIN